MWLLGLEFVDSSLFLLCYILDQLNKTYGWIIIFVIGCVWVFWSLLDILDRNSRLERSSNVGVAQGSKSWKISHRAIVHEKNRAKNWNRAKIVLLEMIEFHFNLRKSCTKKLYRARIVKSCTIFFVISNPGVAEVPVRTKSSIWKSTLVFPTIALYLYSSPVDNWPIISGFLPKQWAADNIFDDEMRVPPHPWKTFLESWMLTCQGISSLFVLFPKRIFPLESEWKRSR